MTDSVTTREEKPAEGQKKKRKRRKKDETPSEEKPKRKRKKKEKKEGEEGKKKKVDQFARRNIRFVDLNEKKHSGPVFCAHRAHMQVIFYTRNKKNVSLVEWDDTHCLKISF